jgi:hypothetical protein
MGALIGIAIVLFIAIVARRSERRTQEAKLQIVQDKIRRRQEQLAAQEAAESTAQDASEPYVEER